MSRTERKLPHSVRWFYGKEDNRDGKLSWKPTSQWKKLMRRRRRVKYRRELRIGVELIVPDKKTDVWDWN